MTVARIENRYVGVEPRLVNQSSVHGALRIGGGGGKTRWLDDVPVIRRFVGTRETDRPVSRPR